MPAKNKSLTISKEQYHFIFNNIPIGACYHDADGVIIDCNEIFADCLCTLKHVAIGQTISSLFTNKDILGALNNSFINRENCYEGEFAPSDNDTTKQVRVSFKVSRSSNGEIIGGLCVIEDFTERKQLEQLIQYEASYDPLTGLPNRRLLLGHLNNELARARRHSHYGALLFLDLDNFKLINDSLGHSVGDELLKVVANRINENIRQEDIAARMGGDEFVIIITELETSIGLASYDVKKFAEKLKQSLSAPCQINEREIHITPSVGIAIFPGTAEDPGEILKQADAAMYRSKNTGRNKICFFLPRMQEAADKRLRLTIGIKEAIEKEQLALFFQPQVNSSGEILGAEALLRWNHSQKGLITPTAFMEMFKETELIQDIGQWVLRNACRQIKEWTNANLLHPSHTVYINVSGKEIEVPGYVDMLNSVVKETGIDPGFLGIELTESHLVSKGTNTVNTIIALKKSGIKFSIDDFGTGYSSLRQLKSLPLDVLKIDSTFVHDIEDGTHGVVLVDTIILIASKLGLDIIAEGVETEHELLYLKERGCETYQGFYFCQPVSVKTFTKMLELGRIDFAGNVAS